MTTFLRLLIDKDKQSALLAALQSADDHVFEVEPTSFRKVPGAPFAYWVSEAVRGVFDRLPAFENGEREAGVGLQTSDDFRFVRLWSEATATGWVSFAKGGAFSPFYADVHLVMNWESSGAELKANIISRHGSATKEVRNQDCYFRPGLTWPRRTNGLSFRVMPAGCIFADKGPAAFVATDDVDDLFALACLLNSHAFGLLVSVQLARTELAQSYEVGLIQQTPIPRLTADCRNKLVALAKRAWSLRRALDTVMETSHAFLLPTALRVRLGSYDPPVIEMELAQIQREIDGIAFDLYGFAEADRQVAFGATDECEIADSEADDDEDDERTDVQLPSADALLSWVVGVALGRFDWRLATGERQVPPEPEPFDPLPAKSPGMLPDGAAPFHAHPGILVVDSGHPHDLARLVEEVLERVKAPVPNDVRRWLQKDFFPFHLQRYSKSRRKAPIYWPLATESGSYTLWVYYPTLSDQTLYRAVNDFVEPKLKQVSERATQLRSKGGGRSRAEEREFEEIESLEVELTEFRDSLLKIATNYHPNQDDGVQITAAPLWPLFRDKPWQKVLKETWGKLEKGEYDWAHLAMSYWPERVREKCKSDKSLAIAHNLEDLYAEGASTPKKAARAKKQ
jgi:hypothetical protein